MSDYTPRRGGDYSADEYVPRRSSGLSATEFENYIPARSALSPPRWDDLEGGWPAPASRPARGTRVGSDKQKWWEVRGSNPRHSRCKRDALPLS